MPLLWTTMTRLFAELMVIIAGRYRHPATKMPQMTSTISGRSIGIDTSRGVGRGHRRDRTSPGNSKVQGSAADSTTARLRDWRTLVIMVSRKFLWRRRHSSSWGHGRVPFRHALNPLRHWVSAIRWMRDPSRMEIPSKSGRRRLCNGPTSPLGPKALALD
jgi:hypothetical protein